jgi:hypothetical protein
MLGVSRETIFRWRQDGLIVNPDGDIDIKNVVDFIIERERKKLKEKDSLYDQKARADIAWKEAQVDKIKEKYIERAQHELILNSRASGFQKFFEQSVRKNAHYFIKLEMDQVYSLFMEFGRQLMEAWTAKGKDEG